MSEPCEVYIHNRPTAYGEDNVPPYAVKDSEAEAMAFAEAEAQHFARMDKAVVVTVVMP